MTQPQRQLFPKGSIRISRSYIETSPFVPAEELVLGNALFGIARIEYANGQVEFITTQDKQGNNIYSNTLDEAEHELHYAITTRFNREARDEGLDV